jgi:hypothetical protein
VLAVIAPIALVIRWLTNGDPSASAVLATHHGEAAILAAAFAGALVTGLAMLDRRNRFPFRGHENRTAVVITVTVVVIAAAGFAAKSGRPDTWLKARWSEFATVHPTPAGDVSRFGTGTSNRYDYWRVSWQAFRAHPLGGVGSGAFSVPWFRARALDENVTDPHSWEAAALAETGVVGIVLLAGGLLIPLARIPTARRQRGAWPIAAIGLGGAGVYFVVHASLDWLFRVPAIALPGFVVLGALGTGGRAGRLSLAGWRQRLAFAVVALTGACITVPLYASTSEVSRAESRAARSPSEAVDRLDRAAQLNPFAVEPLIVRATILQSTGAPIRALEAAREATRKAPNDWLAWAAVLGSSRTIDPQAEETKVATRRLRALNPRALSLRQ